MKYNNQRCPLLEISLIPLTQGKFAIVDIEDYSYLMQWKWCAHKHGSAYYARRGVYCPVQSGTKTIHLHREIIKIPKGLFPDHINRNGLDNRKCNLRTCSHRENLCNQSPQKNAASRYKGVGQSGKRWLSRITHKGKRIHLGTFNIEVDAAKAYDEKARVLFGEFACCNFPEEPQA